MTTTPVTRLPFAHFDVDALCRRLERVREAQIRAAFESKNDPASSTYDESMVFQSFTARSNTPSSDSDSGESPRSRLQTHWQSPTSPMSTCSSSGPAPAAVEPLYPTYPWVVDQAAQKIRQTRFKARKERIAMDMALRKASYAIDGNNVSRVVELSSKKLRAPYMKLLATYISSSVPFTVTFPDIDSAKYVLPFPRNSLDWDPEREGDSLLLRDNLKLYRRHEAVMRNRRVSGGSDEGGAVCERSVSPWGWQWDNEE